MIKIKKSMTADTRTATELVSKETLLASSKQHISDVRLAMEWMCSRLFISGRIHDWTKIDYIDEFHRDFAERQQNPEKDFKQMEWYHRHITSERHHLPEHCPEDVDLFDVLERIADIVMAGMGRSGQVYDDQLDPEILQRAYQNTVRKLIAEVKVEDT